MEKELFTLSLAFRGLSDESEEELDPLNSPDEGNAHDDADLEDEDGLGNDDAANASGDDEEDGLME